MSVPDPAGLQRGDNQAVDWLYQEFARTVLGWVIRLGGPGLDAPDVAHDVFAVAITKLHTWRKDAPIAPWLFGITRRVVANARRRAALRRFFGLESIPEVRDPGEDPSGEQMLKWRRYKMQTALETLSDSHREVITVCDLDERSAPEAAEILGVPVGTVYSRLHAARKALGERLRADLGDEGVRMLLVEDK